MAATSLKAQQSAATREEIITACLRLFAHRGFHNTSIAEIAKAAGITKGAIYWHFESKEALFAAILDKIKHDWQKTVALHVDEIADPRLNLEKLFDNYLLLFKRQPEVCLFMQRVMLEGVHDKYSGLVNQTFERTAKFIAGILERGAEAGTFKRGLDTKQLAHAILGSFVGANMQCHANKNLKLHKLMGELKRQVLERVLA